MKLEYRTAKQSSVGFGIKKNEETNTKEGSKGVEKHHPKSRRNRAQNKTTQHIRAYQ